MELFQGRRDGPTPEPQEKNLLIIPRAVREDFNTMKEKELVLVNEQLNKFLHLGNYYGSNISS